MQSVKSPPRFLPTLTEVIPPPRDPQSMVTLDPDLLVDNLMQTLLPRIQVHLQDSLEQMVQDHLQILLPRLQQEVETALRQAVGQMQSDA
jgi:hypothetical protein